MPDNKEFDQTQKTSLTEDEASACAADDAAEDSENEAGAEGETSAEYEALVKLKDENAALKDKVLREAAEMENLRRRTAKDVADAKTYAAANFARDMLVVADNLSRALAAIPMDARANDPQLKALAEGVEATERAMQAALERHGVHKMETVGQKFDPNIHEAIGAMEDKSVPHNTVKHEAEAGYMIHGRVLRPAKVMTAQGGEK